MVTNRSRGCFLLTGEVGAWGFCAWDMCTLGSPTCRTPNAITATRWACYLSSRSRDGSSTRAGTSGTTHSLVLEEGGVGLVKMGYKVATTEDLEVYEKRAQQFGCLVERMSKGDNPEVGDGVRIMLPSEHVLELYSAMTLVGTAVGNLNPEVFPGTCKVSAHRTSTTCWPPLPTST